MKSRLLVLFLIVFVLFDVGLFVYFFYIQGGNKSINTSTKEPIPTVQTTGSKNVSPVVVIPTVTKKTSVLFAFPVDKKYQDKLTFVQLNYQVNSLGFNLSENTYFSAGFDGLTEVVEGSPNQRLILLTSIDRTRSLRYLFSGEALIATQSAVKKGNALGKLSSIPLPARDVNLTVQYFEGSIPISLSKENIE